MSDAGDHQGDHQEDTTAPRSDTDLDSLLQREIEQALGNESLMDLVDPAAETVDPGTADLRRGTVVAIQGEDILVDLGTKSTGVLPIKQLGEEALPEVGTTIEVAVTGYNEEEGLVLLSRRDAVIAATWETLERGQNVEGRVTGHNKGGLELTIDGIDAFMPVSQIDRVRIESEDLPAFVSRRLNCQVVEIRRSEKSVIVSRRAFLEQEAAQKREDLFETLVEQQTVSGTVKTIMPYGAFVDIGGADGLLHVRDMGYARVEDPRAVVKEGQELTVMILKIDREEKKIALGLKQVMDDPWTGAEVKWPVDTVVGGRVTRLAPFGAFMELTAGVEGLIPIGEMTYERRINHPKEVVNEGDVVDVRVLSVDTTRRRISLSLKRVGDDPWLGASVRWPAHTIAEGVVRRLTDFGAFVELAPGVEGLVHISELAEGRVHSAGDVVKVGQQVQAKVLSVDEERRRMSLSVKQLASTPDWTGPDTGEPETAPVKPKRKKPLRGGLDR